ncbi:VOC family protein [Bacillus luteolus]|uniref:VOC family protein n=1 Tax=Litchfieldia luteola TaxID=682179 RepID=A0ABR9QGJ0_9BACI|nr:VOC family protein [Cytobacillus luteolus]MBE4907546.1 VOC family protein [Cytobacillus luteolus]MBP1944317.1 PhnB protein [Cytobacillus luteolus]
MFKKQTVPYLSFVDNAREALEFYKEVFEGEILNVQTFGEADYPTPPEISERIMHAQFKKDDLFLMFSDSFLGHEIKEGNQLSLVLEFENQEEINKVYKRLSETGTVYMELQDTFWGATFAKVKDKFGITWDLNYQKDQN